MSHSVKEVVELTGIPRNTLLAWERRHAIVEPRRQSNGYRLYSDAQVARLIEVRRLIARGHKVSEAISLLDQDGTGGPPGLLAVGAARDGLYAALMAFDPGRAHAVLRRVTTLDGEAQVTAVYIPVLQRIGDGWATGRVTVAQEHFATEFIREQILSMITPLSAGVPDAPLVVCGGYPGEQHDLPLLALGLRLAVRGYRLSMLGADVPLEELCDLVRETGPDLICVSVIRAHNTAPLVAYALKLRDAAPVHTRIVIGGRGLPRPVPQAPSGVTWLRSASAFLELLAPSDPST